MLTALEGTIFVLTGYENLKDSNSYSLLFFLITEAFEIVSKEEQFLYVLKVILT